MSAGKGQALIIRSSIGRRSSASLTRTGEDGK